MLTINEKTGIVKMGGRQVATLRNQGTLCDIRKHDDGFLYQPEMQVAVNEELLEMLPDSVVLQFTNLDSNDIWSCTVRDFRHMSEPHTYVKTDGSKEPQRKVELARMNHTRSGSSKKRVNELVHIEADPIKPRDAQLSLLGWMNFPSK